MVKKSTLGRLAVVLGIASCTHPRRYADDAISPLSWLYTCCRTLSDVAEFVFPLMCQVPSPRHGFSVCLDACLFPTGDWCWEQKGKLPPGVLTDVWLYSQQI